MCALAQATCPAGRPGRTYAHGVPSQTPVAAQVLHPPPCNPPSISTAFPSSSTNGGGGGNGRAGADAPAAPPSRARMRSIHCGTRWPGLIASSRRAAGSVISPSTTRTAAASGGESGARGAVPATINRCSTASALASCSALNLCAHSSDRRLRLSPPLSAAFSDARRTRPPRRGSKTHAHAPPHRATQPVFGRSEPSMAGDNPRSGATRMSVFRVFTVQLETGVQLETAFTEFTGFTGGPSHSD